MSSFGAAVRPGPRAGSVSGTGAPVGTVGGFMWLVAGTAAIGGFLYGYDTGIISGALLSITAEFRLSHLLQEVVPASILFGATIGAVGAGAFADRFGRRRTVIVIVAIFGSRPASCLAPDCWRWRASCSA